MPSMDGERGSRKQRQKTITTAAYHTEYLNSTASSIQSTNLYVPKPQPHLHQHQQHQQNVFLRLINLLLLHHRLHRRHHPRLQAAILLLLLQNTFKERILPPKDQKDPLRPIPREGSSEEGGPYSYPGDDGEIRYWEG